MVRKIFDKISTLEKRRNLKKNQTETEILIWNELRARRFNDIKFRRQYGVGEYILDFYSPQLKLAIEIDGNQHYKKENLEYDKVRTKYLNNLGIKVIRFKNIEVLNNLTGVLEEIKKFIN